MRMAKYPWLNDVLQDVAEQAATLGLTISHYNSGVVGNQLNGLRVFPASSRPDGYVDFFQGRGADTMSGDYLAHLNTIGEVTAFLTGYSAGLTKGANHNGT